ncbi:hypothetical protein [Paenibacillus wenxiniae]|uniref:Uncharacterized protein n=1 Tax=Paenibacillus wenxiniae TaxID=1636843 RepID=A0ABW4RE00_9BACL
MITRKQQAEAAANYNQQRTNELRERLGDKQPVKAKTFFVWTLQAQHEDRSGTVRAGKQAKAEYLYTAPKWMLDRGLIVDAADGQVPVREGQSDIFEF